MAADRSACNRIAAGLAITAALFAPSTTSCATASATQSFVVEGTHIGAIPTGAQFLGFVGSVMAGVAPDADPNIVADGTLVDYPASFWPVSEGGFGDPTWNRSVARGVSLLSAGIAASGDDGIMIAGQSQGAVVASQYKVANPTPGRSTSYLLISNPGRPNGGFLERFDGLRIPVLEVNFTGATPDIGGITYDVGRQYDGWSDFPKYPLNVLSTLNAIAGIMLLHGVFNQVADVNFAVLGDPSKTDIRVSGDTTYYTIATDRLPILKAFERLVPSPILTALDAPLRVIVEWGYDRQTNPGMPTTASLWRVANPVQDVANLIEAVRVGIDNGIAEAANDPTHRPLGTTPVGMYGVGGRQISPQAPLSSQPQLPATHNTPIRSSFIRPNVASAQDNSAYSGQRKAGTARIAKAADRSAG